jgi:hypothetical protein
LSARCWWLCSIRESCSVDQGSSLPYDTVSAQRGESPARQEGRWHSGAGSGPRSARAWWRIAVRASRTAMRRRAACPMPPCEPSGSSDRRVAHVSQPCAFALGPASAMLSYPSPRTGAALVVPTGARAAPCFRYERARTVVQNLRLAGESVRSRCRDCKTCSRFANFDVSARGRPPLASPGDGQENAPAQS